MNPETTNRKEEHVKICSNYSVESQIKTTGFEDIEFVHSALPELDKSSVDLSTELFGKKLQCPLVITAMTGGHEISDEINKNLAKAAQKFGIAFGLGSQRAMIENPDLEYTYVVRDVAPSILLFGNLGVQQLKKYSQKDIQNTISKLGIDVFAIHLNNLQEAIQLEGDTNTTGSLDIISDFVKNSKTPVLVKETGAGISMETARKLIKAGVAGIDISGAGGTSFSAVEILRTGQKDMLEFWDWGIPTAASILEVRSVSKEIPLIATGGIRTGLDAAKALALGANAVGIGLPLLKAAQISSEKVEVKLKRIIESLRTTMFLIGANDIPSLRNQKFVIGGRLKEWLESRKITL